MKGPLMNLIYFMLMVVGLALVWFWFMYSSGVHGAFRFRWLEWENWLLLLGILACFGIPLKAATKTSSRGVR